MQIVEKILGKNRIEYEQRVAVNCIGHYHYDSIFRSGCGYWTVPLPEEKVGEADRTPKESTQEAKSNAVEVGYY